MFFQGSQDLTKYASYRSQEIKALRESLCSQIVTPKELDATRIRLEKLRKEHDLLEQEDHSELKKVIKNSQEVINTQAQQKKLKEREVSFKESEIIDLNEVKKQLQAKLIQAESHLRREVQAKEAVLQEKNGIEGSVRDLEAEIVKAKAELKNQEELANEVSCASNELDQKISESGKSYSSLVQSNQLLSEQIHKQIEKIRRFEEGIRENEHKISNNQLRFQNLKLSKELYDEKIAHCKYVKDQNSCRKEIHQFETSTERHINDFANKMIEMSVTNEREYARMQRDSKDLLLKLIEEEERKEELSSQISSTELTLCVLKEKNASLKSKLNDLFRHDSEAIKMLASKKVHCLSNTFSEGICVRVREKENSESPCKESKRALQGLFWNQAKLSNTASTTNSVKLY